MSINSNFSRKVSLTTVALLIVQQCLLIPLLAAQDGLGTDGLPSGANVVAGSASVSASGAALNINTQSNQTIINWNQFSVGAGNSVNFNQPGINSAVLNRVITANPSAINGAINSNGNVYLVNPSGIVVGPSGVINTNGFTASTFDIANQDFLSGNLNFSGNSTAGILNQGSIQTGNGGVHLIGNNIVNEGVITSSGNINLVTGGTVHLNNGVSYTQADQATVQNGISETAGLIRNSGVIRATGSMTVGGEVYLVSPNGKVFHDGIIAASKTTAPVNSATASIEPKSIGGDVVITGEHVELNSATVDVSGNDSGGNVSIGGGFQGNDASIQNAKTTMLDNQTSLLADALTSGDGGQVVVWSNEATQFDGTISSTGGVESGNGGLVEVSGKSLAFTGNVDTTAVNGDTGWLLLDPVAILVIDGPAGFIPIPGASPVMTITDGELNNALSTSNVLLATQPSIAFYGFTGSSTGIGGLNDDDIVVSAGTEIITGGNTIFFSTSKLSLFSEINGNVAGGLAASAVPGLTLKDPTVVDVRNGFISKGSITQAAQIVADGGTVDIGIGNFDSFVVERPNLTFNGAGALTFINTSSPAVTVAADGTTIQNMNLVGTGMADDVGVLLDGIASPNLTDVVIRNVNIFNMDNGILSQGDIGDGNLGNVDVTIESTGLIPSLYQDFLQSAINVDDTDGDVVYLIRNIVISDGLLDFNTDATGDDGISLGDIGGATLDRIGIINSRANGIEFGQVTGEVNISNLATSAITENAIRFDGPVDNAIVGITDSILASTESTLHFDDVISDSEIMVSQSGINSSGNDGIRFDDAVQDSTVTIGNGNLIQGDDDGINIDQIDSSTFEISDNTAIRGINGSGIEFDGLVGPLSNIQVIGNTLIFGGEEGIEFDAPVVGSLVGIADNAAITSIGSDGIQFKEDVFLSLVYFFNNNIVANSDGIKFESEVNLSAIGTLANRIGAQDEGIQFDDNINLSLVGLAANQLFVGGSGIAFSDRGGANPVITNSLILVLANTISGIPQNNPDFGIQFEGLDGLTTAIVNGNTINQTESDGLLVQNFISDAALLRINNNTFGSDSNRIGNNGIDIDDVTSSRGVAILNNEIYANGNAIEFDGLINDSNIEIFDNPVLSGLNGNGIEFQENISGTTALRITNNMIDSGMDGIGQTVGSSILDSATVLIDQNVVDVLGAGGTGIFLRNIGSSNPVVVDNNSVSGGAFGVQAQQSDGTGLDGLLQLSNLLVDGATDTGIYISNSNALDQLEVTLQNNVTIKGGASANDIGLVFDGLGLAVTGNTLGNTQFLDTNGNFIELRNGGLFEPGRPTLIDATGVNFDGISPLEIAGFQEIEDRVIHFIDDQTLGLFFPGFRPLNDLTYDQFERYTDYNETIKALIGGGYAGSINLEDGRTEPNANETEDPATIPQQTLNTYDLYGN